MRVSPVDVFLVSGGLLVAAGLYGFWGWPAAALFAGFMLLLLAVGAKFAERKG